MVIAFSTAGNLVRSFVLGCVVLQHLRAHIRPSAASASKDSGWLRVEHDLNFGNFRYEHACIMVKAFRLSSTFRLSSNLAPLRSRGARKQPNLLPPRLQLSRRLVMEICGFVTVISITIIISASATHGLDLIFKNRTASALELPSLVHCNASASWLPEATSPDDLYPDCFHLTLRFLQIADQIGRDTFEFHAAGVPSSQWPLRTKLTPLKYSYSTHLSYLTVSHFNSRSF